MGHQISPTNFVSSKLLSIGGTICFGILFCYTLSGCIRVLVVPQDRHATSIENRRPPTGQDDEIPLPVIPSTFAESQQCALTQQVDPARQLTGSWCWAASAQLVVEYLTRDSIAQCDLVTQAFEDQLRALAGNAPILTNCCDYLNGNSDVGEICDRGGWPEWILQKRHIVFQKRDWSIGKIMEWNDVTQQICQDLPFIFTVQWNTGGRHSAVGGGYHTTRDYGNFVEVYDHSPNEFYVMPFLEFQGGGRFTHEFDYVDLKIQ